LQFPLGEIIASTLAQNILFFSSVLKLTLTLVVALPDEAETIRLIVGEHLNHFPFAPIPF
jgi:hypothetical protein